jgi:acetyl-CoA C-acetyltransferase
MSRAPFVLAKSETPFNRKPELYDSTIGWRFTNPKLAEKYYPFSMGETAENVAGQWKIAREEQDAFALASQEKYYKALEHNKWKDEIVTVQLPSLHQDEPAWFSADEQPRRTSMEKLSKLKPVFKPGGSVTAGNSSAINDGAAAVFLCNESALKNFVVKPMARVVSLAVSGVDPSIMGIGPVPAINKAIARAGIALNDVDLFEINEAFASQSLACIRELGIDVEKVNVNGGAIAIGHPLGCSGVRISTTLLYEMGRRQSRYGVAAMCVGVGQGAAIVYENLQSGNAK